MRVRSFTKANIARARDLAEVALVPKTMVSIRLDREVLDHFKSMGPGYQTRINAVLRAYMEMTKTK